MGQGRKRFIFNLNTNVILPIIPAPETTTNHNNPISGNITPNPTSIHYSIDTSTKRNAMKRQGILNIYRYNETQIEQLLGPEKDINSSTAIMIALSRITDEDTRSLPAFQIDAIKALLSFTFTIQFDTTGKTWNILLMVNRTSKELAEKKPPEIRSTSFISQCLRKFYETYKQLFKITDHTNQSHVFDKLFTGWIQSLESTQPLSLGKMQPAFAIEQTSTKMVIYARIMLSTELNGMTFNEASEYLNQNAKLTKSTI